MEEAVTAESVSKHLGEVVEGTSLEVGVEGDELGQFVDLDKVRKVYKLDDAGGKGKGKKGDEAMINGHGSDGEIDERKEIEGVVLGIMTVKGS